MDDLTRTAGCGVAARKAMVMKVWVGHNREHMVGTTPWENHGSEFMGMLPLPFEISRVHENWWFSRSRTVIGSSFLFQDYGPEHRKFTMHMVVARPKARARPQVFGSWNVWTCVSWILSLVKSVLCWARKDRGLQACNGFLINTKNWSCITANRRVMNRSTGLLHTSCIDKDTSWTYRTCNLIDLCQCTFGLWAWYPPNIVLCSIWGNEKSDCKHQVLLHGGGHRAERSCQVRWFFVPAWRLHRTRQSGWVRDRYWADEISGEYICIYIYIYTYIYIYV